MTKKHFLLIGSSVLFLALALWLCAEHQQKIDQCSLTNNAAWISGEWVWFSKSVDEIESLVENAEHRNISTLFIHATHLKEDSTFRHQYEYAESFTISFKERNDNIKLLGWIGLPLVNDLDYGIQGWVNLNDPETRKAIVDFSIDFLEETGMDGIHIDAETVKNEDEGFLLLLEELDAALGNEHMLSIAGAHWWPNWMVLIPPIKDFRWTRAYYNQVAERVDQIAVMTYDSHLPLPFLYRIWVSTEVQRITKAVEDTSVELLFGVSISDEASKSHRPKVENLETGIRGICVANPDNHIAIYAFWEWDKIDNFYWILYLYSH